MGRGRGVGGCQSRETGRDGWHLCGREAKKVDLEFGSLGWLDFTAVSSLSWHQREKEIMAFSTRNAQREGNARVLDMDM